MVRRRLNFRLALVLAAVVLGSGVPPRVAFYPFGSTGVTYDDEGAVFLVRVEPNAANRKLKVFAVQSDDADSVPVQSTSKDLDGDRAPITWRIVWRHIPAEGDVMVFAALYESGEQPVALARRQIQVMARR